MLSLPRLFALALTLTAPLASGAELLTAPVRETRGDGLYVAEASVEAVRQSVVAAQVAGRVTQLLVKAGDSVRQGQVLARIDAQAASQQATASQAQVEAARAQLEVAQKEFARQQQLFAQRFISQAALEQAEAQFKATGAAVRSTLAQAGAATTQTGFFTLTAPFAGKVAEVPIELGDMALPGRAIATVYDPAAMRVLASLPQSRLALLKAGVPVRIEFAGLPPLNATSITVLPTVDATSHSVQLRLTLPPGLAVLPGMFARASVSLQGDAAKRLRVPVQAVIHRTELDAVYVVVNGKPLLRQVRLGNTDGAEVEVLAGLRAGEAVALDPLAAANAR
jgi:multidrug efflux system membrane fusion protein